MFALPRGISKVGLVIENQRRMYYELAEVAVFGNAVALETAIDLFLVLPRGGCPS